MWRSRAAIVEPRPAGDRHSPPTHSLVPGHGQHARGRPGCTHRGWRRVGARGPKGQCWGRATPCRAEGTEPSPPVAGVSQWVTREAGRRPLVRERWPLQRPKAGVSGRGDAEPLDSAWSSVDFASIKTTLKMCFCNVGVKRDICPWSPAEWGCPRFLPQHGALTRVLDVQSFPLAGVCPPLPSLVDSTWEAPGHTLTRPEVLE